MGSYFGDKVFLAMIYELHDSLRSLRILWHYLLFYEAIQEYDMTLRISGI